MMISAGAAGPGVSVNQSQRPKFVAVSTLEDVQVIIINICTVIVLALQSCSDGGWSSLLSLKPSNSRRCDAPSSTRAADSGRWGATVKHWGFVSILRWRIWGGYLLPTSFLVIVIVIVTIWAIEHAFKSCLFFREGHTTYQPTVMFKRTKHHKGSIYCLAWSPRWWWLLWW